MEKTLNNFFKIKERDSNIKTELFAGITTFMTIVYLLAVIPLNLGQTGMDKSGVFTATIICSLVGTLIVGLVGNFPFALAPSMGMNSFFAFSIVIGMGKSFRFALVAGLISSIILLLLTVFKIRELLFDAIPQALKLSMVAGIGLFISFIGLKSCGIIEAGGAVLKLGNMSDPKVYLAFIGIILLGVLEHRKIKGANIIVILLITFVGCFLGVTKAPDQIISLPPSMSETIFKGISKSEILSVDMLVSVFTFLFVAIFDTIGALAGLAVKADLLDESGKLQNINRAYLADSIGGIVASLCGASLVATTVESASGIGEGGKTGLTAVFTSLMLVISLFFSPIFLMIPATATAPVLVCVGCSMMSIVKIIDWEDMTETLPAFLTIIAMPLTYSIADGIMIGILSFAGLKIFTGRSKEVSVPVIVLSVLFILKIIFI